MHGCKWLKLSLIAVVLSVVGCASQQQKVRKEQQQKIIQANKFYCEYLNGEQYYDIDVAVNVNMGQKCDPEKPFSLSQYRTPSDVQGVMYCCSTSGKGLMNEPDAKASVKKEKKADEPAASQ